MNHGRIRVEPVQPELSTILQRIVSDDTFIKTIANAVAEAVKRHILEDSQLLDSIVDTVSQNISTAMSMETNKLKAELKTATKTLSDKIQKLESAHDEAEQYSRRNCLLIHGAAESTDEKTASFAC